MLYFIEQELPGYDLKVRSTLVKGTKHRIVIDTLMAPTDMASWQEHNPTLIIYTHADWDHCWGSNAFPNVPIIAHELTKQRLTQEEDTLKQLTARFPQRLAGAAIVLPDIVFTSARSEGGASAGNQGASAMQIDAGNLTLELHHVPGHTDDSIWIYIPELETLIAGDCLEAPLPTLGNAEHLNSWISTLKAWEAKPIKQIIPSHGPISDRTLITKNRQYLEQLGDGATPDLTNYPPYYLEVHEANVSLVSNGQDAL